MTDDMQPHALGYQMFQFMQYLGDVLAKLISPPAGDLVQLLNQVDEIRPKDVPNFVANPLSFYPMSSFLYQNVNPTMGELSHALSVPLPTATRMVDWWIENGYAERLSDPFDRRIVRVNITARGLRLHEIVEMHLTQIFQQVLDCLTADEQETLLTLFRRVSTGLKQADR